MRDRLRANQRPSSILIYNSTFKIFLGPDSLIGIKLKNGQDQYQILQRLTGGLMKILHEVEYKNFTAKDVEKILKDTYTAGRLEKQKV